MVERKQLSDWEMSICLVGEGDYDRDGLLEVYVLIRESARAAGGSGFWLSADAYEFDREGNARRVTREAITEALNQRCEARGFPRRDLPNYCAVE